MICYCIINVLNLKNDVNICLKYNFLLLCALCNASLSVELAIHKESQNLIEFHKEFLLVLPFT